MALEALVLAGTHRADRAMVAGKWVAGKWVAEDGAIPGLNRPALKARQDAAAAALHATE
jgi:8-oxoguanine deaminase